MSTPSRVVYRALLGGYEQLREEPVAHQTDIPFVCFTDDPELTSQTWTLVLVEPRLAHDSTRSARALKILGHPRLDDYEQSLWVDNTVELLQPPDDLFEGWLGDAQVAAPLHSFRTSLVGEAEAVIDAGYDDFARVYEQLTHYVSSDPTLADANPHWTGMLLRRAADTTTAAMQTWWEHVLRYSRRDQLSFVAAMRGHDVRLRSVEVDNHASPWHRWPQAQGRDPSRLTSGLREALRPPAARIGELEVALDTAVRSLTAAVDDRDRALSTALADLDQRAVEVEGFATRLHESNLRIAYLEAELERSEEARIALRVKLDRIRAQRRST